MTMSTSLAVSNTKHSEALLREAQIIDAGSTRLTPREHTEACLLKTALSCRPTEELSAFGDWWGGSTASPCSLSPGQLPEAIATVAESMLDGLIDLSGNDPLSNHEMARAALSSGLAALSPRVCRVLAALQANHEPLLDHLTRHPGIAIGQRDFLLNYVAPVAETHNLPNAARLLGYALLADLRLSSSPTDYTTTLVRALGRSGSTAACDALSFVLAKAAKHEQLVPLASEAAFALRCLGGNYWPVSAIVDDLAKQESLVRIIVANVFCEDAQYTSRGDETAFLAGAAAIPSSKRAFHKAVMGDWLDDQGRDPRAAHSLRSEFFSNHYAHDEDQDEDTDAPRRAAAQARRLAEAEHEWMGLTHLVSCGTTVTYTDSHTVRVRFTKNSDITTDLRLLGRRDILVDEVTFERDAIPSSFGAFQNQIFCQGLARLHGLSALRIHNNIDPLFAHAIAHALQGAPIAELDLSDSQMPRESINHLLDVAQSGVLERLDVSGLHLGIERDDTPGMDNPLYAMKDLSAHLGSSLDTLVAKNAGLQYMVVDAFCKMYTRLPNLAHLDLSGDTYLLYSDAVATMADAFRERSPKTLALSRSRLTVNPHALGRVIEACHKLESLQLDNVWHNDNFLTVLRNTNLPDGCAFRMRGLKSASDDRDFDFDVSSTHSTSVTDSLFNTPPVQHTARIDLSENPYLGEKQLKILLDPHWRTAPVELILAGVDIRRGSAGRVVARSEWLPGLTRLDISGSRLEDQDVRALAEGASNLRHLACGDCLLNERSLATLARGLSTQLRSLDISGNGATDDFLEKIATLDWPNLMHLNLDRCPDVYSYGIKKLVFAPFMPYLLDITIGGKVINVQRERARAGCSF